MSGEDPVSSRVRRMLPSVSEVLKELTSRAPIEPDIAFRAAREVCAEELKRIRDAGGDSVPLEDLVQRALVRAAGGASRMPIHAPQPPPPPAPVFEIADEPAPLPEPAPPASTVDDPFSETTGAMDLRWDRDAREPFSEAQAAEPLPEGVPVPDARTAVEAPILPPDSPGPLEPATSRVPRPFALPAEEDAFGVPSALAGPLAFPAEREAEEGPGDETLSRLSREAESIDLRSVFPKGPETAPVPFALSGGSAAEPSGEGSGNEPVPPPFEDDEDTVLTIPRGGRRGGDEGGPRFGVILGTVVGLAALAGLGYLLVGLWVEREAATPPVAVVRAQPTVAPAAAPTAPAGQAAAVPEAGTPPPHEAAPAPATEPPAASAPEPSPVSATLPAPTPLAVPTKAPRAVPTPAPASAPAPVPVSAAPVPSAAPAIPVRVSRDGLVVTKDRAGQGQIFSIHFTSYKDRASAERDLKRIVALVGRDGYVAEIDLGEKGIWQRVMIGEFATAQEAKAVREELAAKGTRDMGWVYRVVGPEAAERR